MRIRKNPEKKNTLQIAFIFCILISFLLFVSFVGKAFFVIKKSNFDGQHRFTILFANEQKKQSGTLISFAPESNEISVLKINTKTQLKEETHGILLGIPIDAYLKTKDYLNFNNENKISDILQQSLFNKDISTNLTIFDLLRLLFFVSKTSSYSVNIETENTALDNTEQALELQMDKNIVSLFGDETIAKEKVSIQIINATGILGLGNKFARLINNMGGNVISVSTSNNLLQSSSISYFGEKNYTLSKLEGILNVKSLPFEEKNISDIIVVLGKDRGEILSQK